MIHFPNFKQVRSTLRRFFKMSNPGLRVTLVRHGETQANADGITQGQSDYPLSEVGRGQAQLLGKYLQNERFTKIISSDLSRAYDTAKIIVQNLTHPPPGEIHVDVRLRERCFGEQEGKSHSSFINRNEEVGNMKTIPPGAETLEAMGQRIMSFFEELCLIADSLSENSEEHWLVTAHGGIVSGIFRRLHSRKTEFSLENFDPQRGLKGPDNTGIADFTINCKSSLVPPTTGELKRTIVFSTINHTEHLENDQKV